LISAAAADQNITTGRAEKPIVASAPDDDVHNAGSEFIVRLPLLQPLHEPPLKIDPKAKTLSGCRILVVDDNIDSANTMGMLLRHKGNEIRIAHDGLQAMEVAETFRPEVVLLYIGLPKLNGYDVARRIREQPWGRHVMLVAMTGWGNDEDKLRSQEAGFNFHLVKPVDFGELNRVLATDKTL
jgi:CheY-like chemotaxis protein